MRKTFKASLIGFFVVATMLTLALGLMGCGYKPGNLIPGDKACEHNYVLIEAVDPTCVSDGLTAGSQCSICGKIILEQKPVEKVAHQFSSEYSYDLNYHWFACACGERAACSEHELVWEILVEPTEHTDGLKKCTCLCGYENTEVIPMYDHDYDYLFVVTKPTCEEVGYTTHYCYCGESYVDNYVEATGHTIVVDPVVPATCTEDGLSEGQHCSVCEEILVEQEVIEATGHEFVWEVVIIVTQHEHGLEKGTCSECGEVKYKKIPAYGHDHSSVTIEVTEPTCSSRGYTTYTCSCGYSYQDDFVAALPHTEVIDEAIAPTCCKYGYTQGSHCSVCGTIIVAREKIEKLEHVYVWTVISEPTEEHGGLRKGVCSCGMIRYQTIPALVRDEEE